MVGIRYGMKTSSLLSPSFSAKTSLPSNQAINQSTFHTIGGKSKTGRILEKNIALINSWKWQVFPISMLNAIPQLYV